MGEFLTCNSVEMDAYIVFQMETQIRELGFLFLFCFEASKTIIDKQLCLNTSTENSSAHGGD